MLVFIQSPSEVLYALHLYEEHNKSELISIYIIKSKPVYDFIKSLDLNLKSLTFIPYPKKMKLFNLFFLVKEKIKLSLLFNKLFRDVINEKVYFFSNAYDYIGISIILKLNNDNFCILFDYEHDANKSAIRELEVGEYLLIDRLYLFLYQFFTGFLVSLTEKREILLSIRDHNIKAEVYQEFPSHIIRKYSISVSHEKNCVLIYESPSANKQILDYESTMKNIIDFFHNNQYEIFIKPHPQKGYSIFLETLPYSVTIINSSLPGEMLLVDDFSFVLGINTSSIVKLTKLLRGNKNIFSILLLFDFKDKDFKEVTLKELELQCKSLQFINSMQHLENIVHLQQSNI